MVYGFLVSKKPKHSYIHEFFACSLVTLWVVYLLVFDYVPFFIDVPGNVSSHSTSSERQKTNLHLEENTVRAFSAPKIPPVNG